MIKIAICDDEDKITKELALYVTEYAKEKCVELEIDCYTNPFELLAKSSSYELFFLDIDIPEMNGIEMGFKIKDENGSCEIVYVTNYVDYAYRSFSVRPFGYIVKPFTQESVFKELDDYVGKKKEQDDAPKIHMTDGKTILNLYSDDVLYFEYIADKHVDIVLDDKKYHLRCSLKYFYEKVEGNGFTYPHKSFIVNMRYIEKLNHFELIMKNDIEIPIAQKKKTQFMEEYNMYLQNVLGNGR